MKSNRNRLLMIAVWLVWVATLPAAVCQSSARDVQVSARSDEVEALEKADEAFDQGRLNEAMALYEQFLDRYSRSRQTGYVMNQMAEINYRQGNYQEASDIWEHVINRWPRGPEAAAAAYGLGRDAFRRGECHTVSRWFSPYRGQAEGEQWEQMTVMLASCAEKQGDVREALDYYSELGRKGAGEQSMKDVRGRVESIFKDMPDDDLERMTQRYDDRFPGDAALIELLRRQTKQAEYERADRSAERFEKRFSDSEYAEEFSRLRDRIGGWLKVKPNRVGVMLPLSGNLAALGEQALKGVMLATGVFNEQTQPMFPAELLVRDTGDENAPVERLVEELAGEEVVAIVGPLHKRQAERAALVAQQLGVPLISLSPGESLPEIGPMVYQNCLTKTDQVRALVDYAMGQGAASFGVFYPEDDYGRDYYSLFMREVLDRGGQVSAVETYPTNTTDFRDKIKHLKSQRDKNKFDFLFIPDGWSRVAMIAPQLRYMRMSGLKLLGVNSWHSPQLLFQTQPADIAGAVFTDGIDSDSPSPSYLSFSRKFNEEYGMTPGLIESQAYETMDLLLYLLGNYNIKNRPQLKTALDHVVDYPGALGRITVTPQGKLQKPVYLYTIEDHQFKAIGGEPAPDSVQ